MMLKFVFLTAAFAIGVAYAVNVPVVLIGAEGPTIPSLPTVKNEQFASILTPLAAEHMIAVIQEEGLSVHDFMCKSNRTEQHQSCYAYLQSVSPKTFYRSVENPVQVLEAIDPNYETFAISKGGKLETPLKCKAGRVVFLRFSEEDTGLGREDTLEAHDYAIANLMKQQISCPTIYLYTSSSGAVTTEDITAHKRSRRALSVGETAAPDGGTIFYTPKFQIFYTTLAVQTGTDPPKQKTIANMNVADHNNTDFTVTLTSADGADTITFDIELVSQYYYMKHLTYNKENIFRTDAINAPTTFSYYCGNLTVTSPTGVKLLWNSLQLQAPFSSKVTPAGNNYFKFGESWNCVGFVTPAILAGLFVVAILLAIMFAGICWMLDINTMDRFDDPKGKTITINANE
ncbi:V-type proton ATPase subunit S1 [Eurosta solidaginis]|uniref:V-type proton ATPase subunit S1 n=1 Tax=Eurosta solidaginis TaxID=178769 RepID=UPI00353169CF